jgi:MYXO-CTERM domain-containing protein
MATGANKGGGCDVSQTGPLGGTMLLGLLFVLLAFRRRRAS